MIGTREIEYEHTVQAWTVGDLHHALDGVPDDAALSAIPAETPGGDTARQTGPGPRRPATRAGTR